MSEISTVVYVFSSDEISEAGQSRYGAYAQGRVLRALGETCGCDWSQFPSLRGADGDLFANSQRGETPGRKVLHDLMCGYNGLGRNAYDFGRLNSDFEYDGSLHCVPYVVAIGPLDRVYADRAHERLKQGEILGYLGVCRLPYELTQLARSMGLVAKIKIERGAITGGLASKDDLAKAGLTVAQKQTVKRGADAAQAKSGEAPCPNCGRASYTMFAHGECPFCKHRSGSYDGSRQETCIFCHARLEKWSYVCPECGKHQIRDSVRGKLALLYRRRILPLLQGVLASVLGCGALAGILVFLLGLIAFIILVFSNPGGRPPWMP